MGLVFVSLSIVKKEGVVGHLDRCRKMNWRTLLVCALAVALYAGLSLSNSCQASLIMVDMPQFTLENVSQTASTAGDSSSRSAPDHWGQPDKENPRQLAQSAVRVAGSSAGTSSSSSSSPSDGGSPAALARLAARLLADPLLAEWLSGGAQFNLPRPPVNSLFRPPQV